MSLTAREPNRERRGSLRGVLELSLLLPADPERRNRRTIDAVLVAAAAVVAGLAAVVARSAPDVNEEVGEAVVTVLGWAPVVWKGVVLAVLLLALAVVVAAVVRKRWLLVRDLVLALAVVAVAASVLARIVDAEWTQIETHLFARWGFPELRMAAVYAVFAVARAELIRPVRVVGAWLVVLASVGLVALGAALPSQVLAGLAVGLGAGSLVRLTVGSPLGIPPTRRVLEALGASGST